MDKLKKIKLSNYIPPDITYDDNGEYYYVDDVDAHIAEMQAEIESEKQNYDAMSETCLKKIEENIRLMKELDSANAHHCEQANAWQAHITLLETKNAALMEVLEAIEDIKLWQVKGKNIERLRNAMIKAREVINASKN